MKLFYCPRCGGAKAHVKATAKVEGLVFEVPTAQIEKGELLITGDEIHRVSLDTLENVSCVDCGEPIKLQEFDECPHMWYGMGTTQLCVLCRKRRHGRIVFD